jgi:hypothetical protein
VETPQAAQPLKFNSSERRGTARLMSTLEACARQKGFVSDGTWRNDGRGRFKGNDVRNRTGGGRATERTVCKLGVTSRVVMRVVRGHWGGNGCGTELQQKRRTTCRHEANGHIRTKQEDDQQETGHQVAPAIVEKALPHVLVHLIVCSYSLFRFKVHVEGAIECSQRLASPRGFPGQAPVGTICRMT